MFRVVARLEGGYILETEGGNVVDCANERRLVMAIRELLGMPHQGRPKGSKNLPKGVDKTPE